MAYVSKDDMIAVLPADFLTVAVDDRHYGDDIDNVWPIVADAATRRVDSILGSRYSVPFAEPLPALVKEAAIVFAAHMLYLRRQAGENNPWAKEASSMMERLGRVASGELDLTFSDSAADPVAIVEPSRTYGGESGRLMI
jgi:phage gp36-like protein